MAIVKQILTAVKSVANVATAKRFVGLFVATFVAQVAALGTSHLAFQPIVAAAVAAARAAVEDVYPALKEIRSALERQNPAPVTPAPAATAAPKVTASTGDGK